MAENPVVGVICPVHTDIVTCQAKFLSFFTYWASQHFPSMFGLSVVPLLFRFSYIAVVLGTGRSRFRILVGARNLYLSETFSPALFSGYPDFSHEVTTAGA